MPFIAEVTQCRGQQWSPVLQTSVRCVGLQGDTWQAHVLRMSAVHSSALAAILGLVGGWPCVYRWPPFQNRSPPKCHYCSPSAASGGNFWICAGVSFQAMVGTLLLSGHSPVSCACVLPFPFLFPFQLIHYH